MNSFKYIQTHAIYAGEKIYRFSHQMKMKRSNLYGINFLEKHFHPIVLNPLEYGVSLSLACLLMVGTEVGGSRYVWFLFEMLKHKVSDMWL